MLSVAFEDGWVWRQVAKPLETADGMETAARQQKYIQELIIKTLMHGMSINMKHEPVDCTDCT